MERDDDIDISLTRIARAVDRIDPAFLDTPQGVSDALSGALGREIVVKNETETPIGSFKGRGTWLLAEQLDPAQTWVCSTAGNFGQGLAYAARARGASVHAFVSPDVPAGKRAGMRALGAAVELVDDEELGAAQRLTRDTLGLRVEPAGAAGVAASDG